jgi:hypothetical protein
MIWFNSVFLFLYWLKYALVFMYMQLENYLRDKLSAYAYDMIDEQNSLN